MATTYKYQQNLDAGASAGYVQYNITPDFDTVLAVGETFQIEGKMYCGDMKRYGIAAVSTGKGTWPVELGWVPQVCNRGRTATFSMQCTVNERLGWPTNDGIRGFNAPIFFDLYDSDEYNTCAPTVNTDSAQQYYMLTHRIGADYEADSRAVYDATTVVVDGVEQTAYERFCGAVQGKSDLTFEFGLTPDPLDPSVEITEAEFKFGDKVIKAAANKVSDHLYRFHVGVLPFSGTFDEWEFSVSDNKGIVSDYFWRDFVVHPYTSPVLRTSSDKPLVERYSTGVDTAGNEVVKADDAGNYLRTSFVAEIGYIRGGNAWTITRAYAEYGNALPNGNTVLSDGDAAIIAVNETGEEGDENLIFPRTIIFDDKKKYTVRLALRDCFEEVVLIADVDKAGGYFNIEKFGVAAGMRTTATEQDKKFESAYPFYPYAGIKRCDNAVYEVPLVLDSSNKFIRASDASPLHLLVYGNVVHLIGEVTPAAAISGSVTEYAITILPNAYAPKYPVAMLCQGGAATLWLLKAYPADDETFPGLVTFSRYRNGSSYASCAAGTQLPFFASWMVGGVSVEEDPNEPEEDNEPRVVRPAAAMTGYNSQGCVVTYSTEYNDTYAAWRAFDKSYSDRRGWATDDGTPEGWIQLQMDVALKKISVTIINRTFEYPSGPENGVIYGSNDGEEWQSIGTFGGRDGETSALKTVHECNNDEIAYRYVRVNVSRNNNSDRYVAVGEIIIEGVEVQ